MSIAGGTMRLTARRVAGALTVLAAVLASAPPSAVAAENCRAVQLPVSLQPDGAPTAVLSGDLCARSHKVRAVRRTVQVLVSGTAYDKSYWDFPYQPDT